MNPVHFVKGLLSWIGIAMASLILPLLALFILFMVTIGFPLNCIAIAFYLLQGQKDLIVLPFILLGIPLFWFHFVWPHIRQPTFDAADALRLARYKRGF